MSDANPLLVIQPPLKHAGFAACVLAVLNHLRHCEREGLEPVVHIDKRCETRFLDEALGDNVWEQYFEPVGRFTSDDVKRMREEGVTTPAIRVTDAALSAAIREHDDSIYTWVFGRWRANPPEDLAAWFETQRKKGIETVQRHVRVKPEILDTVQAFFDEHVGDGGALGVHLRGTDLAYAPPVSPAECFPAIEAWLERHPKARLFLATDQVQYVGLMEKRYGERLVYRDCLRSSTSKAAFNRPEGSPYRKGEDVLIDLLLLSRCDFLIRGASNIPEMAIYFAGGLETLDLSLEKRFAFGQDYLEGWSAQATRPAWDLIRRTDLESVDEAAASQSPLQRLGYAWRRGWAAANRTRKKLKERLKALFPSKRQPQ